MNEELASEPLNSALVHWAARALGEGRIEAALLATKYAVEQRETIDGLSQLGVIQGLLGNFDASIASLQRLTEAFPTQFPASALHALGIAKAQAGRLNEAIQDLERSVAMQPDDGISAYHLASCLAVQHRFVEADAIFSRDIPVPCGDGKLTSSRIVRLPLPGRPIGAGGSAEPPFERRILPSPASHALFDPAVELVYFVCCDARYFELFAEPLAKSIVCNGGMRCILHIHLVNPTDDATRAAAALGAKIGLGVAISTEQTDLDRLSNDQRRTYYACARYFVLPDLLRAYDRPILVADIDQLVVRDLNTLMVRASTHDISMIRFPQAAFNLLSYISASVLIVNRTEDAVAFCTAVRSYLSERMREGSSTSWHLDQAALAVAHLALPNVRYDFIPPQAMLSAMHGAGRLEDPLPECVLFWSVTYSIPQNAAKLRTEEFREYFAVD